MDKAEIIAALWRDLLEKDDRTSPAEYPDMALITRDEFEAAILAALSSPPPASAPDITEIFDIDAQLIAARAEGRREGFAAAKSAAASVVNCWSLPTIQTPSMWLIDKAGISADILALADQEQKR